MRPVKLLLVPSLMLLLLTGWIVFDTLQAKKQQRQSFSVPDDGSGKSLLQFMRRMDGSVESGQTLLRDTSSNLESVCAAVFTASE